MNILSDVIKVKKLAIYVILYFFLASTNLLTNETEYIKNPSPTHVEKKFVKLVKIKEISSNINDEHFMVRPISLTVDNKGNIFVFDLRIKKIFKFDKNYKFVKVFGRKGQGPGEFGLNVCLIYFSKDGYLYVGDNINKKIIKFDTDGNHIKDFKLPISANLYGGFLPVINNDGDCFVLNGINSSIDAYNIYNKDIKNTYRLLNKNECNRSVVLKLRKQDYMFWSMLTMSDLSYDMILDNRLIIYLARSSAIYIYKKKTLIKKFYIWPKNALELYKERIEHRKKNLKKNDLLILYMFYDFFVDKDNEKFFYLSCKGKGNKKEMLYKFDIEGNLIKIFYSPVRVFWLKCKRNNLFYGIFKDNIYIFKEDKNE